jgi:predicted nucleic acid-binding protein
VDATDMLYLEMALAGQAAYVVSGDHHLLDIGNYEGIVILTPTRFASEVLTPLGVDPGDPTW